MPITNRSVITFLFVFFSAGLLLYVLGMAESNSGLTLSIVGDAPIPYLWLLAASAFTGTLCGFAMEGGEMWPDRTLAAFGPPLFFVMGFGEINPILVPAGVFVMYIFMYTLVILSVGLMRKKEIDDDPPIGI